jgi:uncharacterized repeat protein (TIGR03803 family)
MISPVLPHAQNLTVLHAFSTNNAYSPNRLVLSGNTLYGVAAGVTPFQDLVFAINTDGTGYTNLHTFGGADGATPNSLIVSGNTLYGSTDSGTLFAMQTDGSGFTNLYRFSGGNDGANPLVSSLAGNVLYGVASRGGAGGSGTVFAINTDGSDFTVLYSFSSLNSSTVGEGGVIYNNQDGAQPADMVLSGDSLYGTTSTGGPIAYWFAPNSGAGNVFDIKTNGTGFAVLYSFPTCTCPPGPDNGQNPNMRPVVSGNVVYGVTPLGGWSIFFGVGTVFAVNVDGSGFHVLHTFQTPIPPLFVNTNDGAGPQGPLTLSGNTLYGTTSAGGAANLGTIFQINTNGSGFTLLESFAADTNGYSPQGPLIVAGNTIYGTTSTGGTGGGGTIFKMSVVPAPPQLTITTSATNLVLTWPTNVTGYAVQSATNLNSFVWEALPVTPAITNGEYLVTFPLSGTQQFYRLRQ